MPNSDLLARTLERVKKIEKRCEDPLGDGDAWILSVDAPDLCRLVRALIEGHHGDELYDREIQALREFTEAR